MSSQRGEAVAAGLHCFLFCQVKCQGTTHLHARVCACSGTCLDENLPPERLNAPTLDAICVQRGAQAYIRQVELLQRQGVDNPRAKGSQEEIPRHHFSQAADVPR